jgi:hypothetical protein
MRRLPVFVLALLIGVTAVGCDSNDDDDPSDAEIFVGTWTLVSISDQTGDRTDGIGQFLAAPITANFASNNTFTITINYNAQAEGAGLTDSTIPGSFVLKVGAKSLQLSPTGFGATVPFDYTITNENQITLTADAAFMNALFTPQTAFQGRVTLRILRSGPFFGST